MKSHKKVIDTENIEELKNLLALKNRELEIEAALERVRTMTMAMHKTEGLIEVIKTVFMQFELLEVRADVCFINIHQADSNDWNLWVSTGAGQTYQFPVFPYIENPVFRLQLESRERGDSFYTSLTDKKSKDQFFDHFFKHLTGLDVPKARLDYIYNAKGIASSFTISRHATIALANYSCIPYTEEENLILHRIGKVFEQTYTRFLDLQKAESQAREAQIEAALERVRSRTMAMHKSQELSEVATVLFQQMSTLNLEPVSCALGIYNEKGNSCDVYFSIDGKIFPESLPIPNNINQNLTNTFNAWIKGEKLQFHDLQGEEAKYHDKSIINYLISKGITLPAEAEIVEQPRRVDYHALFSHGLLLFSYTMPIDETGILVRFAKVFEQAYLRFLDIQKAEAQAREAQIEVALERVRSRTMAMQHSDELGEVVNSIFNALKQLDYNPHDCTIFTFDFEEEAMNCWSSVPAVNGLSTFQYLIPIIDHPFIDHIVSSFKKKQNILNYHLAGEEKESYDDLFFQSVNFPEMEVALRAIKELNSSFIFMSKGAIATFTETSLSENDLKILERFSKVVDLSYSRFLDLQKAEAQAREAKIEAALEKVRAASMAMQKSKELTKTSQILFEEVTKLGIDHFSSGICVMEADQKKGRLYFSINGLLFPFSVPISYQKDKHLKRVYQHWKKGDAFFVDDLKGQALMEHNMAMAEFFQKIDLSSISDFNNLQESFQAVSEQQKSLKREIIHLIYFDKGAMFFISETEPISQITVLKRFAKVFEQSYTRFLDLQKAEAQARESEIQLALERVRARTMAMHTSAELADAASVLFQQILALDLKPVACAFVIVDEKSRTGEVFISADGTVIPDSFMVPYHGESAQDQIFRAWKKKEPYRIIDLNGAKLEAHLKFIARNMPVGEMLEASGEKQPDRLSLHIINFRYGFLGINFLEPNEQAIHLLQRFAKVFEQTYTRFLDLKKAEAQAREAEIEAALERVRSASMAMHKSEELANVASVCYQELISLGAVLKEDGFHITLFSEDSEVAILWMTEPGGTIISRSWELDLKTFPPSLITYQKWKETHFENRNEMLTAVELSTDEIQTVIHLLSEHPVFSEMPITQKWILNPPSSWIVYDAFFSNGTFVIDSFSGSKKTESLKTHSRFAKIFEQTYTRFLDLKKAEAQAREAQIEAALERIRSASMAMHKSEELPQVALTFLIQIEELAIPVLGVALSEINTETNTCVTYFADNTTEGQNRELSISKEFEINEFWLAEETVMQMKSGEKEFTLTAEGERLELWIKWIDKIFSKKRAERLWAANLDKVYFHAYQFHNYSNILFSSLTPLSEEYRPVIQRLVTTFRLSYLRFLDLQKAEAQAREAEIQLALERVRARTMAMHKSDELVETSSQMFQQLELLGIKLWTFGFNVWVPEQPLTDAWSSSASADIMWKMQVPHDVDPVLTEIYEHRNQNISIYYKELKGEQLQKHIEYMFGLIGETSDEIAKIEVQIPSEFHFYAAYFKDGYLLFVSDHKITEASGLFPRFAMVFEQTYTRFLDLQKAETQAREAQIEAALERIRSASMAMHKSEELPQVALTFLIQIEELAIPVLGVGLSEINPETNRCVTYFADNTTEGQNRELTISKEFEMHEFWLSEESIKQMKSGKKEFTLTAEGERLELWIQWIGKILSKKREERLRSANLDKVYFHTLQFHGYSSIIFSSLTPLTEEYRPVIQRLVTTFRLSYLRFLDLQKAEAQSREAEIQLALERVRARTMAMQNSTELAETASVLFEQLRKLDSNLWSCGFVLCEKDNPIDEQWMSVAGGGLLPPQKIPHEHDATHFNMYQAWEEGNELYSEVLEGERLREVGEFLMAIPSVRKNLEQLMKAGFEFPTYQKMHAARFSNGYLLIITMDDFKDTEIFIRFAKVFDQTFTRFLDLQKAEEQAREAQIEASMERIRSRSLAMRTSDEIKDVMVEIRRQIDSLGQLDLEASVVHLYEKGNPMFESIAAVRPPGESGNIVLANVFFPVDGMDRIKDMMDYYWSDTKEYTLEFDKEMAEEWQQVMLTYAPMIAERRVGFVENRRISDHSEYWNFADFSEGSLLLVTHSPASDDTKTVLRKAAQVFDFAYRRFRDLQKAEARALEAIKQASLDRVRGVISSMRSAGDLDVITPLIFKELMTLGVPFIRCGVFIINEKQEIVEAYLSSPEGKSLGVLRLPYQASELTFLTVEAWKRGEVYRQHWSKEDFVQWIHQLMEQDQIQDSRTYQGTAAPPESLDLHFVPFTQGMLYVGNVNPLDEKELELVQSLAKAFSIAFARYEDFVKLEKAKVEVESAMSELKATQSQLVQQEKLASLGQLTAGIAHEIKNPLNFVNNFSEVSMELIEEVLEEIVQIEDNEHATESAEILSDIKSNLKKIHEHGTRANGIVSSMLQHSRGGSGKKETTDLNALIKEYVNLSFHGMRAGKNQINVDIVLDLDPEIKEMSLIKEDFTRVIINLCNNAFDAMREKEKKSEVRSPKSEDGAGLNERYLPKLKVTTMLEKGQVRIAFEDNGPGIPDEIKDKILQPFFTTKKGTEGTGLGLSITHDIIKAHGGELIVNSEEGIGSIFLIKLGL